MNIKRIFSLGLLLVSLGLSASAQFSNCTAAFLNNKLVVDEYTTKGKCVLSSKASGQLTVCTADLSPKQSVPIKKIDFKIAIRDGNSKTITSYSDQTYRQIDIRKVLTKCKKGDSIVLITLKNDFALPHNEILIN